MKKTQKKPSVIDSEEITWDTPGVRSVCAIYRRKRNDLVYQTLLKNHEPWEIEEMLEDPKPEEDFFDPMEEYGIPYRGEF